MARMLRLLGNEVRTAHDGLEAVEAADEFRPEVILMDVGMPRLNGYDATRRIREQAVGAVHHDHRADRLGPGGRPATSRGRPGATATSSSRSTSRPGEASCHAQRKACLLTRGTV